MKKPMGSPRWQRTIGVLDVLFERILASVAAVIMFLMMLLTFVDVIGRNLFNAPLPGGFEVTELLLAVIIFLGLPMVTAEAAHVDVDICDPTVPEWLKPVQDTLIGIVNIACFGTLSWMLWRLALRTYQYQDTTAILEIPYAGLVFLMAAMASLSTTALVAMLFLTRGRKLFPTPSAATPDSKDL